MQQISRSAIVFVSAGKKNGLLLLKYSKDQRWTSFVYVVP